MITVLPWGLSALTTIAAVWALKYGLRERRRRKGRPLFDRASVPLVSLAEVDPVFADGPLGYTIETEAHVIGDTGRTASTSTTEAWILCVLARRARRIFEFGTCTGRTTYLLARNTPPDAEVVTITLSPDTTDQYVADAEDMDAERWESIALRESVYSHFFYEGTDVAHKVRQVLGDSKTFDESGLSGRCDLVFIDGSHAYSYVKSDTEKALNMVRDGGLVVWHDFSPACPGVWRYLDELGRTRPLMHVRGTTLVVAKC